MMRHLRPLAGLLTVLVLVVAKDESGWTCETDGFYYQNGVKSDYKCDTQSEKQSNEQSDKQSKGDDEQDDDYTCVGGFWTSTNGVKTTFACDGEMKTEDKSKDSGCTGAVQGLTRTCMEHPSDPTGRCWWTYVPSAVSQATDGRKVPLVVDMHGGGGCASHQVHMSGFRELAEANASEPGGGMVVVYPQGKTQLWASSGTSSRKEDTSASKGKPLPDWDDVDFLEQLIKKIARSSPHKSMIDFGRVYMSGFSLGCMMAHRFSLERSELVAAFGCHGGELSYYPTSTSEMDADMARYDILPMPAYITIGNEDTAWFPGAQKSFQAWRYWNGCTSNTEKSLDATLVEHQASSCRDHQPALETVMLEIKGGSHSPDRRATRMTWDFVSRYSRASAHEALTDMVSTANGIRATSGIGVAVLCALAAMMLMRTSL